MSIHSHKVNPLPSFAVELHNQSGREALSLLTSIFPRHSTALFPHFTHFWVPYLLLVLFMCGVKPALSRRLLTDASMHHYRGERGNTPSQTSGRRMMSAPPPLLPTQRCSSRNDTTDDDKGERWIGVPPPPTLSFLSSSPTASCRPRPQQPESALTTSPPQNLPSSSLWICPHLNQRHLWFLSRAFYSRKYKVVSRITR